MVSPLFRRSRHAMALLALLALLPGWGAAQAQAPAAPALPPPDSVRLEQLGLMQGFPPAADKRVDVSNGYRYPQLRWVVQHLREIQPTQNIRRGAAAPSALPEAPMALGGLRFDDDKGQPVTVDQWLDRTYTDAIVVLHKGRVVFERYQNQASSPHLLFSVTKSFTGLMAAQLAHEGRIDPQALVTKYVPELEGSAWGDMTVRQVMDMTGAVRFREDY
ncbi:MAG TPA: 6-aminohexanoate hydrolase, partial [Delftia acidovorans]|nr:6-aminohexanoate hydrolase [Delftia acidovorans]